MPHLASCLVYVIAMVETLVMVVVVVVVPLPVLVVVVVLLFTVVGSVLVLVRKAVLRQLALLRLSCRAAGCALLLQLLLGGRLQPGLVDLHLQRVIGGACAAAGRCRVWEWLSRHTLLVVKDSQTQFAAMVHCALLQWLTLPFEAGRRGLS